MWERFIESSPEYSETKYRAWYFCDNEKCANELAALVSIGIKRATTSLLLWYENGNEVMPEVNDVNIVTDWNGTAQCIIKTKKVFVLPFKNVDSEMAFTEGEGDKSLDYWRKAHVSFFERPSQVSLFENVNPRFVRTSELIMNRERLPATGSISMNLSWIRPKYGIRINKPA